MTTTAPPPVTAASRPPAPAAEPWVVAVLVLPADASDRATSTPGATGTGPEDVLDGTLAALAAQTRPLDELLLVPTASAAPEAVARVSGPTPACDGPSPACACCRPARSGRAGSRPSPA